MNFNIKYTGYKEGDLKLYQNRINGIVNKFELEIKEERENDENHFLGWVNLPIEIEKDEVEKIKFTARKIREQYEALVVLGIGGSFMGAKALISALQKRDDSLEIIFLGNSLSEKDVIDNIKYLEEKDFALNIISKSGTTLETAVAFRIIKEYMKKKYGNEYIDRIYITTDKQKGALKEFANKNNLDTFIIPDNIGGRYSVFTPVGLLPVAAAGIDIDRILEGAKKACNECLNININKNNAFKYAVLRHLLYGKKYKVEQFISYEPRMEFLNKWIVQLFGESEGKDSKGLFPVSAIFTRDLHSIGQFVQEGSDILFETVMFFDDNKEIIKIEKEEENLDNLNYLSGKNLAYINKAAMKGTLEAHVTGGVPNILIEMDRLDEKNLGYLMQFFMIACGMSASLLNVEPFNQPGVEKYKKSIYKILGKK